MNHRHPDADLNDNYANSFRQEAEMERRAFERDVIAALETAESVLFDAAQALANYPGHDAREIHDLVSRVETVRFDLGGE